MTSTQELHANTVSSYRLLGFVTRYDEACRLKQKRRAKQRVARHALPFDAFNPFNVSGRMEREMINARLKDGFRLKWMRHVAGRDRQPFHEDGLRSSENAILKLFVSRVPKGGRARASEDKATLYIPYRSKLLTLDCPYIEMTRDFLGVIRLDCDAVFASPDACLDALRAFVDNKAIPHLPHIVTGDLMPDGTFRHPHFVVLLSPGAEVWNKVEDKRCREQPIRLFDGVVRGWAKALLPLGVDPAAPRLTQRLKNPCSPYWHTFTPNETEFMTLAEYSRVVDTRSSMDALVRHAASVQSGMDIRPSNEAFNFLSDRAKELLRDWHFKSDPRMQGSRERLADELHIALEAHARELGMQLDHVVHVIGQVASWRAANFNPAKLQSARKDKHRLIHEVAGIGSVRERQQIGAQHSAKVRKSVTMGKLVAAYGQALADGEELSVARLADLTGVHRSTVYRSFDECRARCVGEKRELDTQALEETASLDLSAPMVLPFVVAEDGFDDGRQDDAENEALPGEEENIASEMWADLRKLCEAECCAEPEFDDDDVPW